MGLEGFQIDDINNVEKHTIGQTSPNLINGNTNNVLNSKTYIWGIPFNKQIAITNIKLKLSDVNILTSKCKLQSFTINNNVATVIKEQLFHMNNNIKDQLQQVCLEDIFIVNEDEYIGVSSTNGPLNLRYTNTTTQRGWASDSNVTDLQNLNPSNVMAAINFRGFSTLYDFTIASDFINHPKNHHPLNGPKFGNLKNHWKFNSIKTCNKILPDKGDTQIHIYNRMHVELGHGKVLNGLDIIQDQPKILFSKPIDNTVNVNNDYTISVLLNMKRSIGNQHTAIIELSNDPLNRNHLVFVDNKFEFGNYGTHGYKRKRSNSPIELNRWYHVVMVNKILSGGDNEVKLYVNDVEQTANGSLAMFPEAKRIAQYFGGDRGMRGTIDDLRIYNAAFNISDVDELYNAYESLEMNIMNEEIGLLQHSSNNVTSQLNNVESETDDILSLQSAIQANIDNVTAANVTLTNNIQNGGNESNEDITEGFHMNTTNNNVILLIFIVIILIIYYFNKK
jgi:hypothetical protein